MADFKMVTKKQEALRGKLSDCVCHLRGLAELNKALLKHREQTRASLDFSFIPTTMDELMFCFCLNEKRKESEQIWKLSSKALL